MIKKPLNVQLRIGSYLTHSTTGEKYKAYMPSVLPFSPPLQLDELQPLIEKANQALGRLDGLVSYIPDISLLLYFYLRKEALLSSQIEGTQSSFDDLLMYENNQVLCVPEGDVEEVSHYVSALQHGMNRLQGGFPLSLRLIKEMHAILLRGGRGANKQPGEFRQSQNWIGGTRPGNAVFVPPPADQLMNLLGNLEFYLNDEFGKIPTLVKAAISHVQFETIHPFLDGNGRLGRLIITLLLWHEGVLSQPALYLSLYFKRNRTIYYELLSRMRIDGAYEVWFEFFLQGVLEIANETADSLKQIVTLFDDDRAKIAKLKRAKSTVLRVYEYFQCRAMGTILQLANELKISQPTVTSALEHLADLGIIFEISGKKRDRVFSYNAYLKILRADTAPL